MISNESQLMGTFNECGFDFTSICRAIAARFPSQADWGLASSLVLPFRLSHPFADFGPVWKIPINREIEFELPPTMYHFEFHPTDNTRTNFDRAMEQLARILGPGDPGQSSNVYERHWRMGFFTLRLIAWPRELNLGHFNVYEGKNPYLWLSANIYIEPDFPFVQPTEDASLPMETLLTPLRNCRLICDSRVYARRNRVPAPAQTLVVGRTSDAFLIRSHDRTVRVPLGQIRTVRLTRLTPARFSGSASLSLDTVFMERHQVSVSVANGEETHSLDAMANRLSEALERPLGVEEYPDEG